MTLRFVKALHLLGMAMFLGSILGHITAGLLPGIHDNAATALVARQTIEVATTYLTLPGLALLVLTGSVMTAKGRLPFPGTRWLTLHVLFALLILLNAGIVLYPVGQELLAAASQVAAGALALDRLAPLEGREAAFGAANLLLSLMALFVAVIRPRLGGKTRPPGDAAGGA